MKGKDWAVYPLWIMLLSAVVLVLIGRRGDFTLTTIVIESHQRLASTEYFRVATNLQAYIQDLQALVRDSASTLQILDVRSPTEYGICHLPSSKSKLTYLNILTVS